MTDPIDGQIAGRTVVITGAAGGIGRALALGFLRDGAKVIASDITEAGLEVLADAGATPLRVDVTIETDVQHMIRTAVETTGRVDVLFNNAGIGGRQRIEKMPNGMYERFITTHLFGGFYGFSAALPVMRQQNHGRIITMIGRALEELAKGDGSAAWNVMIGSGVGTYAAWLDPDTAFEVFGSQRTVCAAAFMANGVATKIDGGYTTRDAGRTAAAASRARGSTSVNRSRFSVGLSMNCSESMAAPTTITDRQIARYAKIA